MNMYDIILKKRQGFELNGQEIEYFVNGCVSGTIPDYQISALLMAIFFKGLSKKETVDLTLHMYRSGEVADLSSIPGVKVDKHSTGGVGDKTTLVLGPLVASAGVSVAKMSGRGLGHTGGTIDKLESIPGFNVYMDENSFLKQVNDIGIAIVAQTGNLVPADKKLYALRDVTATVENISLIASSVMSKKLASGADAIVLDVKVGRGAFMKSLGEAEELAALMVEIGKSLGRNTVALITRMEEPLGLAVGNSLEMKEAINTLSGRGPEDLKEICLSLGAEMLLLAGKAGSTEDARQILDQNIVNGRALEKLTQLIKSQGGNPSVVENYDMLPEAMQKIDIKAPESGYVADIDALKIGLAAMRLGAGRETKESAIDLSAGILLHKKAGQPVSRGEALATLHYNPNRGLEESIAMVNSAFAIKSSPPKKHPLVVKTIK